MMAPTGYRPMTMNMYHRVWGVHMPSRLVEYSTQNDTIGSILSTSVVHRVIGVLSSLVICHNIIVIVLGLDISQLKTTITNCSSKVIGLILRV